VEGKQVGLLFWKTKEGDRYITVYNIGGNLNE